MLAGYWALARTCRRRRRHDNNSQVDPYAVSLRPAAPNNLTADFGYYVEPAAIGNFVWTTQRQRHPGSGRTGYSGVQVELTITYPNGTSHCRDHRDRRNGYYSFGNLLLDEDYNGDGIAPEPTHSISVGTPAGYTPTTGRCSG